MQLSVVIPCYNEEECLDALYQRVSAACQAAVGSDYEIVLVNDGSRDRTWPMIVGLATSDARVCGVNLARNHGHQLALTAGLSLCRGDTIFVIDADLQDPPELLGAMLETMAREQADVVYGQRRARAGETLFKTTSAQAFYRLLNRLSDVAIPVDTGDFRLMSRRVLNALLAMPESFRFVRGMVAWIGYKQVPLLYDRDPRFAGESKYPLRKMLRLTLDALTGFSIWPLRFASHAGMWLGAAGLLMLAYVVGAWMVGATVAGWASLMTVVILIGSLQMVLIGLLGEYVGRLYMQGKARPLFLVQDVISQQAGQVPGAAPGTAPVLGYVDPGSYRQPGAETPAAVTRLRAR